MTSHGDRRGCFCQPPSPKRSLQNELLPACSHNLCEDRNLLLECDTHHPVCVRSQIIKVPDNNRIVTQHWDIIKGKRFYQIIKNFYHIFTATYLSKKEKAPLILQVLGSSSPDLMPEEGGSSSPASILGCSEHSPPCPDLRPV